MNANNTTYFHHGANEESEETDLLVNSLLHDIPHPAMTCNDNDSTNRIDNHSSDVVSHGMTILMNGGHTILIGTLSRRQPHNKTWSALRNMTNAKRLFGESLQGTIEGENDTIDANRIETDIYQRTELP